jgi:hypothetical protein
VPEPSGLLLAIMSCICCGWSKRMTGIRHDGRFPAAERRT